MRIFVPAPDPAWIPFTKMLFGFMMLVLLAVLAAVIALGKVEQSSSHGLDMILGGLIAMAGGFSGWAFRDAGKDSQVRTDGGTGVDAGPSR